jgi:hypothetical protein
MAARGDRDAGAGSHDARVRTKVELPARAPARHSLLSGEGLAPFLLVVAAAWLARILFLLRQADAHAPTSLLYWGDTQVYVQSALAMIHGIPYDSGIPFHPPGFSALVAFLMHLTGVPASPAAWDAFALRALLALLGSLSVGVLFVLTRRIFGAGIALATAPLAIFSFGHYVQSTAVNAESTFLLLVLVVALGMTEMAAPRPARPSPRAVHPLLLAAIVGALSGAAALMRPEFLLTGLLSLAALAGIGRGRVWRPAGVFLAAALLVLIPWTVRCYRALDAVDRANAERLPRPLPRLVLVSAGGPINFATANNDHASGAFDTRLIERLVPGRAGLALDVAHAEVNRLYIDGYRIGFEWMARHPGKAIALLARKAGLASEALALGYLQGDVPSGLRGERRPVDQFVPRAKGFLWVQLALCLLGAWRLRLVLRDPTRRRAALFLAPHALATLAVILAYFGYVRFGMLLAPIFWILLGAGWLTLVERVPWPAARVRPRPAAVAGALIGVLLLAEAVATSLGPHTYHLSGSTLPGAREINQDDRVWIDVQR